MIASANLSYVITGSIGPKISSCITFDFSFTFTRIVGAIFYIRDHKKPLALYLFTENEKVEQDVLSQLSFGGGCINDTIIHLATPYLGFGGVSNSGMGTYHGKKSFDTFTHEKSIIKKSDKIDIPIRYMPYNKAKEQLMKFFLKL